MMIGTRIRHKLKLIALKIKAIFAPKQYICLHLGQPIKHSPLKPASNTNRKGEANGKSKLKAKEVLEIRNLYDTDRLTYGALSNRFKISRTTIGDIILRRTWRHL